MSVGLALIAKDEEENLPRLLASVEGAFDRVVLLDTGSSDDTVGVFQAWAKKQAGVTFAVGQAEWEDDFSLARNQADSLLLWGTVDTAPEPDARPMVDWKSWADCDDTIEGAQVLRQLAAEAPPEVGAFVFGYDYAQHPDTGACVCHLRRERLVRWDGPFWVGAVHEAQPIDKPSQLVDDAICRWKHHKVATGSDEAVRSSNERNLRILTKWEQREPENSRVLGYLGTELAITGRHDEAIRFYRRYLNLKTGWDEERAQIHRKLSGSLLALDDVDEAEASALKALTVMPAWPDSYMTLAEVAFHRREWGKVIEWARRVLELGVPQTMLIVNPLDYTFAPRKAIAGALGELRQWDEATAMAQEALGIFGADEQLRYAWTYYRSQAKREHTAKTYVMAGQQLIAHDEQLKALTLLEDCVPHFATDHPEVVALRSFVRERTAWARTDADVADFYTDASRPEDFHSDEECDLIAGQLPRVGFLIEGLIEQGAEKVAA